MLAAEAKKLADAKAAGAVTINYGVFIGTILTFVIVAFVVYLLVRAVTKLGPQKAAAAVVTKECPFCLSTIPLKAVKCAHCASELR